jgi:hypothetical protein
MCCSLRRVDGVFGFLKIAKVGVDLAGERLAHIEPSSLIT